MEKQKTQVPEMGEENLRDIGGFFSRSLVFPATTAVAKLGLAVCLNKPDKGVSGLETYLLVSMATDLAEMTYKAYFSKNPDAEMLGGGKPFSCLERHLIYDIPRAVIGKVRNYMTERMEE